LFLTKQEDIRIGDFGISKILGDNTVVAEHIVGTPYYLSPEICLRGLYSFAGDLWALGCVVYELIALRVPFRAQNASDLSKRITSGILPTMPEGYSSDVKTIIRNLLVQDYQRRPSASALVKSPMVQLQICKMLNDCPMPVCPPSSAPPSPYSVASCASTENWKSAVVLQGSGSLRFGRVTIGSVPRQSTNHSKPRPQVASGRALNSMLARSATILMRPSEPSQRVLAHSAIILIRPNMPSKEGARSAMPCSNQESRVHERNPKGCQPTSPFVSSANLVRSATRQMSSHTLCGG